MPTARWQFSAHVKAGRTCASPVGTRGLDMRAGALTMQGGMQGGMRRAEARRKARGRGGTGRRLLKATRAEPVLSLVPSREAKAKAPPSPRNGWSAARAWGVAVGGCP